MAQVYFDRLWTFPLPPSPRHCPPPIFFPRPLWPTGCIMSVAAVQPSSSSLHVTFSNLELANRKKGHIRMGFSYLLFFLFPSTKMKGRNGQKQIKKNEKKRGGGAKLSSALSSLDLSASETVQFYHSAYGTMQDTDRQTLRALVEMGGTGNKVGWCCFGSGKWVYDAWPCSSTPNPSLLFRYDDSSTAPNPSRDRSCLFSAMHVNFSSLFL
ncbi:hypothetical protein L249_0328 [Ophiocordyceps polyrhachis-furcata BCC 54312]|uniref:Uncharacterized protein n=1 Tax=Ophiocordyceps polyrhachis-furcata BCC 54312 TaxID=1330021 RepID=A0A367LFX9_9HYPO|nr:hypothetical protein L249_0328 [Ophiocordyceps polyrhachis-furcata BCC 54312]